MKPKPEIVGIALFLSLSDIAAQKLARRFIYQILSNYHSAQLLYSIVFAAYWYRLIFQVVLSEILTEKHNIHRQRPFYPLSISGIAPKLVIGFSQHNIDVLKII